MVYIVYYCIRYSIPRARHRLNGWAELYPLFGIHSSSRKSLPYMKRIKQIIDQKQFLIHLKFTKVRNTNFVYELTLFE